MIPYLSPAMVNALLEYFAEPFSRRARRKTARLLHPSAKTNEVDMGKSTSDCRVACILSDIVKQKSEKSDDIPAPSVESSCSYLRAKH